MFRFASESFSTEKPESPEIKRNASNARQSKPSQTLVLSTQTGNTLLPDLQNHKKQGGPVCKQAWKQRFEKKLNRQRKVKGQGTCIENEMEIFNSCSEKNIVSLQRSNSQVRRSFSVRKLTNSNCQSPLIEKILINLINGPRVWEQLGLTLASRPA